MYDFDRESEPVDVPRDLERLPRPVIGPDGGPTDLGAEKAITQITNSTLHMDDVLLMRLMQEAWPSETTQNG